MMGISLFKKEKRPPAPQIPQQTAVLGVQPDDSIPVLAGDYSARLLHNTDRGFRAETYITPWARERSGRAVERTAFRL